MSWFSDWFNSPYYHVLYQNRNDIEAQHFLDNLIAKLPMQTPAKLLDLACGKGRHSIYLNKKGFDVTGVDLSKESIDFANQFKNEHLHFEVADMRNFSFDNTFDYILNLFTSFGYFDDIEDDKKVFKNIHRSLKAQGLFIQDYLNATYVIKNLVPSEVKTIDGIDFNITRKVEGKNIIKNISFKVDGEEQSYQEKVKIYSMNDFKKLADEAGLIIKKKYGDYDLNSFDENSSPRLILIYAKK